MSYDPEKAVRLKHLQELGNTLNTKKANVEDVYTKTEVDSKISSTYKAAGSVAFASLPTPDEAHLGYVYNITDAFTTTASFVEGAGSSYPAGTNVAIVVGATDGTYLLDVLSGFVDLSDYAKKSEATIVTASETNGCVKVNGSDVIVTAFATDDEFTELMNDMFGTTA